jgi:hypothetical protein
MSEIQDVLRQVSELNNKIKTIEEEIGIQTEFGVLMKESQNYLLTGIQMAPVSKSYLVTFRGIEVLGEETIPIPIFIDNVMRFANYPKRKIEVLKELAIHLERLRAIIAIKDDTQH